MFEASMETYTIKHLIPSTRGPIFKNFFHFTETSTLSTNKNLILKTSGCNSFFQMEYDIFKHENSGNHQISSFIVKTKNLTKVNS